MRSSSLMPTPEQVLRERSWRYCRSASQASESDLVLPRRTILQGDAATVLSRLPSGSIDVLVTSPPYYMLRRYGAGRSEIGTEESVSQYVANLVKVFEGAVRVLKEGGSVWLNLSDGYSRHPRYGAPPKSMLLMPERVLLALAKRGWVVRNKVTWTKPNPLPSSVRDRLTCTWEAFYFLTRSRRYHFDLDAIRVPHVSQRRPSDPTGRSLKYAAGKRPRWQGPLAGSNDGLLKARAEGRSGHPLGKNPGDTWRMATAGYRGAHFATFPPALVERPIKACCPERVCESCGAPWRRSTRGLTPNCRCRAGWHRGIVLDPFMGSGTTAIVAERLGRDWLGIELKPEYVELATERIRVERAKQEEVNKNDNEGRKTA
jgi:site-specific DNA-methyltransferase (adenine-specific)